MKILHIVGNRPQFIKLAILQKKLESRGLANILVHTGQHYDPEMSGVFFEQLDIPRPDYSLGINQKSHNEMIGRMLCEIDPLLVRESPQAVVVYGDTNSTLAGALAACKRQVPVVHIEAGVRTGDLSMPEETNRILSDRMARLNCCSTRSGVLNLESESSLEGGIFSRAVFTGDLMLDAALKYGSRSLDRPVLQKLGLKPPFVLATIHREENLENHRAFSEIMLALNRLHGQMQVVLPAHPRTKRLMQEIGLQVQFNAINPLGYLDMLALVQQCHSVITDSGGLSREGYFFEKPSLIIMRRPFWPEIQEFGNSLRADPDQIDITRKHELLLNLPKKPGFDLFGDGNAAGRISDLVQEIIQH
jgi:UDP-GlcNAc3NAcA epimerase